MRMLTVTCVSIAAWQWDLTCWRQKPPSRCKSELKDLHLVAVVPFRGQTDRWSEEVRAKYNAILRIVDDVVVLSERYYNGCLLKRNDYMVNHSSRLIAYHDGTDKGGTFYTVKKAGQNGLEVVNLYNSV